MGPRSPRVPVAAAATSTRGYTPGPLRGLPNPPAIPPPPPAHPSLRDAMKPRRGVLSTLLLCCFAAALLCCFCFSCPGPPARCACPSKGGHMHIRIFVLAVVL